MGTVPFAIQGKIHEILQLARQPPCRGELKLNMGLYWECGDYTLCVAPMQYLLDKGVEDDDLPRLTVPRGKPTNRKMELLPISAENGNDKLEMALMRQDTTLHHIYNVKERMRCRWRFDITSTPIPIVTSYPGMVDPVPRTVGPYPDDYGPDYNPEQDIFPRLSDTIAHPPLRVIYWNSGKWSAGKAKILANMAGQEAVDIILITNMQTDFFRCDKLIGTLVDHLTESTGKEWTGTPSPNRYKKRGGAFVLSSSLILDPKVSHMLPYGKLTNLTGRWYDREFDILSAFRPPTDNILKSTAVTEAMHENEALLWAHIGEFSHEWYTLLLGDFGLSNDLLDERLRDDAPESRRIVPTRLVHQHQMNPNHSSGGAILIWNGPGVPAVTTIPTETTRDSTLPILVEIKLPPRDWAPPAFTPATDSQPHPVPSIPDLPIITNTAALPEAQQSTTKGGHSDDQRK